MKALKIIISFITLSVISVPSVFAFSISPNPQTAEQANNSPSTYDCSAVNPPSQTWVSYYSDGSFNTSFSAADCANFSGLSFTSAITGSPPAQVGDVFHFLEIDCSSGCTNDDYATQLPNAIGSFDFLITENTPALTGMIQNASSSMVAALGVSPGDAGNFMWELGGMVVGSGLGFLGLIVPYIVALAIIAAIVYFALRGFRALKASAAYNERQGR